VIVKTSNKTRKQKGLPKKYYTGVQRRTG
jgi:hypothetical protein